MAEEIGNPRKGAGTSKLATASVALSVPSIVVGIVARYSQWLDLNWSLDVLLDGLAIPVGLAGLVLGIVALFRMRKAGRASAGRAMAIVGIAASAASAVRSTQALYVAFTLGVAG